MAKVPLSRLQLEKQLSRKLRLLDAACRRFDLGNDDEVDSIALILRVLWNPKRRDSLMQKLHFSGHLLDATFECPPERIWNTGEVEGAGQRRAFLFGGSRDYAPAFMMSGIENARRVSFNDWWEGEVARDASDNAFSRQDLILLVADKEAAHVDNEFSQRNYQFRFEAVTSIIAVQQFPDGTLQPRLSSPVPFALRHIAFETLTSLLPNYDYDGSIYYQGLMAHMTLRLSKSVISGES